MIAIHWKIWLIIIDGNYRDASTINNDEQASSSIITPHFIQMFED